MGDPAELQRREPFHDVGRGWRPRCNEAEGEGFHAAARETTCGAEGATPSLPVTQQVSAKKPPPPAPDVARMIKGSEKKLTLLKGETGNGPDTCRRA